MTKKSTLEYSPEEMSEYIDTVRDAVKLFLSESGVGSKFSDLLEFMNRGFRTADEQMFKEWTEKEFPGQFTYTHSHTATYNGDEDVDDEDVD